MHSRTQYIYHDGVCHRPHKDIGYQKRNGSAKIKQLAGLYKQPRTDGGTYPRYPNKLETTYQEQSFECDEPEIL
jgi:hypothetical protein